MAEAPKTLRTLTLPETGATVKMGRVRPAPGLLPLLSMERYLGATLPTPPEACDYSAPAMAALADIYGNDQLGDCVIAGGYHVEAVLTGGAGAAFRASPQQIVHDYSAIGGYVPGNPRTDGGCDEVTALEYWRTHGFASGNKLAGWLRINAQDPAQCKLALWLFENLYSGVELPDHWVNPMPQRDGFVWDVAGPPDQNNGHCIVHYGYDAGGVKTDTWGMLGTVTWAALAKYMVPSAGGELYVLLGQEAISKASGKAPNGLNWAQLVVDFDALGGALPVPPDPTPPVPPPVPPVPPAPPTPPTPIAGPSLVLTAPLAAGTYRLVLPTDTVLSPVQADALAKAKATIDEILKPK